MTVGVRPVGDTGWLLEIESSGDPAADARSVLALARAVRGGPAGRLARDVVPAAATVLMTCRPRDHDELGRLVLAPVPGADETRPGPSRDLDMPSSTSPLAPAPVTLDVTFDGPDLSETADLAGTDVAGLERIVVETEWTVAFAGFAPGFGYLVGGGLDIPRLAAPRQRVPAGSLALAGAYAGIYPTESPGGWRLVGRLRDPSVELFRVDRVPPALLVPGAVVRLRS